jgi:hypothetical protein
MLFSHAGVWIVQTAPSTTQRVSWFENTGFVFKIHIKFIVILQSKNLVTTTTII